MRAERAVAAIAAAVAVVSILVSVPRSWSWTSDQKDSFSGLAQPTLVFKYQSLLPEEAVAFAAARLHPKERYYVLTREGSLFAGVSRPTAVRTFTRYALLPAVQVQDPQRADAIVGVGADPGKLGLQYTKVEWDKKSNLVVVARVKR